MEAHALPRILQLGNATGLTGRLSSPDPEREGIQQGMRERNARFDREAWAHSAEAMDRAAATRGEAA